MNEIQIRVTAIGKHQCYRTVNGIYALDVGPAFETPKEAIAYSDSPATRTGQNDLAGAGERAVSRDDSARSGSPDALPPESSRA